MELFIQNKFNPQVFESNVRHATHELNDVLIAAVNTQSPAVEDTHFLMTLATVPDGLTQRELADLGLTIEQWQSGLAECVTHRPGGLPLASLTSESLHPSATALLQDAVSCCAHYGLPRVTEAVLLLSALRNLTPAVQEQFAAIEVNISDWCNRIDRSLKPVVAVPVFEDTDSGVLILTSFAPGARKVLTLLRTEAESLGYQVADPRHLLLGLLAHEDGVLQYGLFNQGLAPKKIQEAVMVHLRSRAKQIKSVLPLDVRHFQTILQEVFQRAGKLAGRDQVSRIAESHLLRAFLAVESSARGILEDERVNLVKLKQVAEGYTTPDEEPEKEPVIADVETVRRGLEEQLIGQSEAVRRILPYIQRMRFGFNTPGRPIGVFLFCGQSGSGKTMLAKELARAVYGSEENLIFLEMGQFNSRESMNIFVGSPPGYVGYGEGKLTNGLRDKPRAVVLFDEVEKAHERVLDALLRFLDEGKIDDPAGPVRDGSQCMLVLTSNIGAEELSRLWSQIETNPNWRSLVRESLREEFKKHKFRVEFLNRVDELILFRTLKEADYTKIAERLLQRDLDRLKKERQIEVMLDPALTTLIGRYCASIAEGARAAQRLTQSVVITAVIDHVLRHSCTPPVRVKVRAQCETNDPNAEPVGVVEPM